MSKFCYNSRHVERNYRPNWPHGDTLESDLQRGK